MRRTSVGACHCRAPRDDGRLVRAPRTRVPATAGLVLGAGAAAGRGPLLASLFRAYRVVRVRPLISLMAKQAPSHWLSILPCCPRPSSHLADGEAGAESLAIACQGSETASSAVTRRRGGPIGGSAAVRIAPAAPVRQTHTTTHPSETEHAHGESAPCDPSRALARHRLCPFLVSTSPNRERL
jgi:hypothetical protein